MAPGRSPGRVRVRVRPSALGSCSCLHCTTETNKVVLGEAIRFEWGPGIVETGKVLVFEPPHRLSFTWEALGPSATIVTFELAPENNGTRLRLTHTGIGRE